MKKCFFCIALTLLFSSSSFAGGIEMEATNINSIVLSLSQKYMESKEGKKEEGIYIDLEDHHVIYVMFTNKTQNPVTATVGQFTLVTSMNRSASFTADMYHIAGKPWMNVADFPAVKVMPGTSVSGFIAYKKASNDELPKLLFFEAGDGVSAKTEVAADE
ncbi:hypothetical protein JCM12178A_03880 [Salidesulfovibrio brasiliensis]